MMPPCMVARVGFWCFLATLISCALVTIKRSRSGITRVISPRLPTSLPDRTWTSSPFFSFMLTSQHFRRERHDAHEAALAQLTTDGTEDAGASRLHLVVDQDRGVLVEADVAAVGTALLLLRAHDDALHHVTLLHRRARNRVLDRGDEDVADAGVAAARATEHLDAQHLARARVVGH